MAVKSAKKKHIYLAWNYALSVLRSGQKANY